MKRLNSWQQTKGWHFLYGFTMAEILLSLTIIGVVAAITLPSLTGNINERTWNTQRKALYARFSQAIALMPSINGFGTLTDGDSNNVAETFVTDGLAKVMKINNICDSEHLSDCGIPDKVINMSASTLDNFTTSYNTLTSFAEAFSGRWYSGDVTYYSYSQINTKAAGFETQNGESVIVYYNPACTSDMMKTVTTEDYRQPYMCANFLYDLNGTKGPNTFGKDIGFITAFYPTDPVLVAPIPISQTFQTPYSELAKQCRQRDSESRVPTREELLALCFNHSLIGNELSGMTWSSTKVDSQRVWTVRFNAGCRLWPSDITGSSTTAARCVKR